MLIKLYLLLSKIILETIRRGSEKRNFDFYRSVEDLHCCAELNPDSCQIKGRLISSHCTYRPCFMLMSTSITGGKPVAAISLTPWYHYFALPCKPTLKQTV